jgi:hypothetical protein
VELTTWWGKMRLGLDGVGVTMRLEDVEGSDDSEAEVDNGEAREV